MGHNGIAVGDVDQDSDPDLLIGVVGGNRVLLNQTVEGSPGVFVYSGQSLGNSSTVGIALGDFDLDGDLDAFFGNNGAGEVDRIGFNDGAGNLTLNAYTLDDGTSSGLVALGDLDNNGSLDAYVGA